MTPGILAAAETLNLCLPPAPGEERILESRFAAFINVLPDPSRNLVQRVRVEATEVEALVGEVRARFRARERYAITWEVGPSSTPPDLYDRLGALGMVPDGEPEAAGMVLDHAPVATESDVRVQEVTDFAGFREHMIILRRCFGGGAPDPTEDEVVRDFERRQGHEPHMRRYLGLLDGRPIAAGDAALLKDAVVLCGGATLPEARGRGAYRALVAERWRVAVAAGTPALVVQAGSMSRPILDALGFRTVAVVRVLLDRFT